MPSLTAIREFSARPHIRPWALTTPVLVLLVALPLLRPLHHPDPMAVSDEEAGRLATVAALVDHHTLALDTTEAQGMTLPDRGLVRYRGRVFSDQPPVMSFLLAGVYWAMARLGVTLARSPVWAPFLLTLLGVTLPVAGAAGLIYKMSRIFELPRPWRAGLAAVVVFGSGWISYAVILNPHAPAAALVMATAGCLAYLAGCPRPRRKIVLMIAGGFCAALAAVVDPCAAVFALLFMLVILAMRWPWGRRIACIGLFVLGAIPPLSLHLILNHRITGDWKPGFMHPELAVARSTTKNIRATQLNWTVQPVQSPDEEDDDSAGWHVTLRPLARLFGSLFGSHGLLTHFPILIVASLGMAAVLHRHWPAYTKALALATAIAVLVTLCAYSIAASDSHSIIWSRPMFANRWFVAFVPMTLFWSGAWIRRPHRKAIWITAGVLLAYSVIVSAVGAFDPLPR